MNGEKSEFWEFVSKYVDCRKCPFHKECNEDKYSNESCADILERVYEERFGSC